MRRLLLPCLLLYSTVALADGPAGMAATLGSLMKVVVLVAGILILLVLFLAIRRLFR